MSKQSETFRSLDGIVENLELQAASVAGRICNMPYANQFDKYRDMVTLGNIGNSIISIRDQQAKLAEQL